jgi:N-acetylmuramoyl-L-alanine amidase-like protein
VTAENAYVFRQVVLFGLLPIVGFVAESRGSVYLPYATVFKGESRFERLVQKAERENWRSLPLGERTVTVGEALLGTPYANYTLEIDNHTESPSANLRGVDCWTYFEISLGFARMLELKPGNYSSQDLLAMIELDRYRGGQCNGSYTSRLHYLEDWIYDNERRGLVTNLTRSLGGVPMRGRYLNEMSRFWRDSRYLRNNPQLVPKMRQIEDRISSRTIYHIPKSQVPEIESKIQDGDVICISGNGPEGFTEHVGLAYRDRAGVLHFMHASKDERKVIIDVPLHSYLYRYRKFAGIMVVRPLEVSQSTMAAFVAGR